MSLPDPLSPVRSPSCRLLRLVAVLCVLAAALLLPACEPYNPLNIDDDGDGFSEFEGDCDDADAANFAGNTEACDGQDNDCNNLDDAGNAGVAGQESDADGDGVVLCSPWTGADDGVSAGGDCDDSDPSVGNTGTFVANDADCDGVLTADDCDDNDPSSTALPEDADCDGVLTTDDCDDMDESIVARISADADCDGVPTIDDCDDTDNTIYPGAPENMCDSIDHDCDGNAPCVLTQVSAGESSTCGLKTDGEIVCWGYDVPGSMSPPGGTFTQVDVGRTIACALNTAGRAECWGDTNFGVTNEPSTTFMHVEAAERSACGLRSDGVLECWGALAASGGWEYEEHWNHPWTYWESFSMALIGFCNLDSFGNPSDTCWDGICGVTNTNEVLCSSQYGSSLDWYSSPSSSPDIQSVSVGWGHAALLTSSGDYMVAGSGPSEAEISYVGPLTSLDAGNSHNCAIDSTGEVLCWGGGNCCDRTPPAGTFSVVTVGRNHACALDMQGRTHCWGDDSSGQSTPPGGGM
jgi:hypothetical protein